MLTLGHLQGLYFVTSSLLGHLLAPYINSSSQFVLRSTLINSSLSSRRMKRNMLESIIDGNMEPRDLRFSLLEKITDDFSEERKIGEGGFAVVYKGILQNREVAVKRITNNMTIDETLFHREVNSLTQVNHQNIVRFLGFCSYTTHKRLKHKGQYIYAENRERLLCLEYISNGSLDNYIADELRGLEWNTRYNIIKGICKGLEYLHMDRHIVHMDLKPANILLDNDMMPKITDFGLSRMDENSRTITANRFITPGYCAPEYLEDGKISVKSDVYSLGAIIIELVSGHRDISDKKNVLRRWSHRWNKAGKETPFEKKQVAKLMEIGMLCKESDPYRRPFISDIIHEIDELERINMEIINENESTIGQEDDMLGIEPLELHFPFELNKQTSCSLQLTNDTNAYIAFSIQTTSPLPYCIEPAKGIVAARSMYSVNITLQPLEKAPQDKRHTGDFIVRSTKLNESVPSENIHEDMFKEHEGKVVDEVNLTVSHKPREPHSNLPLELQTISGTGNQNSLEASNVPEEAESKTSLLCTSDELIQFDPPELRFPFFTNKRVAMLCSIKITNVTDHYVGFNSWTYKTNTSSYDMTPDPGILAPGSTQILMIKRLASENESEDMECKDDMFGLWNGIVNEDMEADDLVNYKDDEESKLLPIVFTKTSLLCTSDELIQFDPPELCFPFLTNNRVPMLCSIKITNVTNHYVGFNSWSYETNTASYDMTPDPGILAPGSTQVLMIKRFASENESEDMQCKDDMFSLWNGIVSEGMEADDLVTYMDEEESKELPIVFTKTSLLLTSDELIQFDRPEIRFPFLTNKKVPMLSYIKITNVTNHYVGFNSWAYESNSATYSMTPDPGILEPGSSQLLKIRRVAKGNEPQDMECKDDILGLWNGIVNEGIEATDLFSYEDDVESKLLPITFTKTSLLFTSDELIQFDPPEIRFPFLTNKKVPMLSSIKITNVTNHYVGFNSWTYESNSAYYDANPDMGILAPGSTQVLKIKRVAQENESEYMKCKDDTLGLWIGIVNEGMEAEDLDSYTDDEESKLLPIVFTKPSVLFTSDELIRFDPPEIRFPFLTNKKVPMLSSLKITNVTNYDVGFHSWVDNSNSASYYTTLYRGILAPGSTQVLNIKRVAKENESEDMECKDDRYGVWNGIVNEGIEAKDLVGYMDEEESKQLPIVFTKTSLLFTSEELIQFDPPEIRFPFLTNKKVPMLSSIKITNVTNHYVGFICGTRKSNSATYYVTPDPGILAPGSTQVLKIKRVAKENESEDMECKDDILGVWNGIVSEGMEAKDLVGYTDVEEIKQLPIVFTKTNLCNSDELIQLDPPELRFPSFPNKKVPMVCSIKKVNVTDHCVVFNTWSYKSNSAWYTTLPSNGILPPGSTKELKVKRVGKENESEDMQCKDVFFVWNCIVNEGFDASDLASYMVAKESKHLPVVFTEPGESSLP